MTRLLFDLFDNLNHNESRAEIFILVFFHFQELFQSHLLFVFWRFLTSFWGRAFSWWSVIIFTFNTTWANIFFVNSWRICFKSTSSIFTSFRRISMSLSFLFSHNNFTSLFISRGKHRSSIRSTHHFGFLLLIHINLFLTSF